MGEKKRKFIIARSNSPRPYFDSDKNLFIPTNIKFGGELAPKLKPRLWFAWIFLMAKNAPEDMKAKFLGSKSTERRVILKLKNLGYLK